ncbi:MAG: amidohydrolase [Balneolaceae bacterium]
MPDYLDIINLRRTLHRYPELANQEFETSRRISEFVQKLNPDREISISKTGKAFVFEGSEEGETIVFRAELDALPIQEKSNLGYRSSIDGVAHLCGHDGHMAILAGLGQRIAENRPKRGKVVLLFQPAEETDLGAKDVVESPEFHALQADYIFALHNIPGVEKNKVLLKTGSFSAASAGMTIKLEGVTSHAAEPEKGVSPAMAVSGIMSAFNELIADSSQFSDTTFTTLIYIRLGEISFGVSPDYAEMGFTLRAFENKDMDLLMQKAERIVELIARQKGLHFEINYSEIYPPTMNEANCVEMIKQAAEKSGITIENIDKPFRWSEDFAYFTATNRGAQFGFGAGENQPPLHNPEYDFPDDIIKPAVDVFYGIYEEKLLKSS